MSYRAPYGVVGAGAGDELPGVVLGGIAVMLSLARAALSPPALALVLGLGWTGKGALLWLLDTERPAPYRVRPGWLPA